MIRHALEIFHISLPASRRLCTPSWFLDPESWLLRRGIESDTDIDIRVDMIRSKIHALNNAMPTRI